MRTVRWRPFAAATSSCRQKPVPAWRRCASEILAQAGAQEEMEGAILARERHLGALRDADASSRGRRRAPRAARAAARAPRRGAARSADGALGDHRRIHARTTCSASSFRASVSANERAAAARHGSPASRWAGPPGGCAAASARRFRGCWGRCSHWPRCGWPARRSRTTGRAAGGAMDHRDVARPLFHAARDPRSRRLVAAAGGRCRVCDRRGLRDRPPACPARRHRSHHRDLRQRAGRGGGDGGARRSFRRARRSRGGGAEPAHPDRGRAGAGGVCAPWSARRRSLRSGDDHVRCARLRFAHGGDGGGRRRRPVAAPSQRIRAGIARGRDSAHRRRNQPVGDAHARVERGAVPDRLRARRAIRARFPARGAAVS